MRLLAFTMCQILVAQSKGDSIQFDKIASLIKRVGSGDRRQIVVLIDYPLARPYPLKSISTPQECMQRFDEVFDETILSEITKCNLHEDWEQVGWRGIIFKTGSLWLNEDYKIRAVNYETRKTKELKAAAIDKQKQKLPASLRDFDKPELEWKTSKYVIRVDRKGEDYRLVVFDRKKQSKILHVFHKGVFKFDGNMGAFQIDWKVAGKTYRVVSGNTESEDCYYVYDSPIVQTDLPDHPIEEQCRQIK